MSKQEIDFGCITNFGDPKNFNDDSILICLHENSFSSDVFRPLIEMTTFPIMALDLPGCGESNRLEKYSMEIVGEWVNSIIRDLPCKNVYLFGHGLGGNLISFIKSPKIKGIALSGCAPLGGNFADACCMNKQSVNLTSLIGKEIEFTREEAKHFVIFNGVNKSHNLFDILVNHAMETDGKFRSGCLQTLFNMDQFKQFGEIKNVVIFHGEKDSLINLDYLKTINVWNLFERKIHVIPGANHMAPLTHPFFIWNVIRRAFKLIVIH